ncbi:CpaF family protein [Roseicella aerolata]|uniref:CpaF family protein n=1 Tax=Roseicella aerolata TaxID=2883479 RepID=A0A9X1IKJ2_9PROT|nr:CpaF family protein [Roseicella aerolata]MCB4824765.1 CpaF family protein [Roseicella aerolata]
MKRFGRRPTVVELAPEPGTTSRRPAPEAAADSDASAMQERLRAEVMERIDPNIAATLPVEVLQQQLTQLVHEVAERERLQLTAREQVLMAEELTRDMAGYGPLDPLLQDDLVSDIMVNGPDCVFVERRGTLARTDTRFRNDQHLNSIAQKIAAAVGRRVDESSPLVDCRLPDGSRVNIVFPPLALNGACMSIRKFGRRPFNLERLVATGAMSPPMARILEIAGRCRLNILISGGTGSGKTTLMNAISQWIDHGERVVTIEDAAELQLQQPHVVSLETRPANLEGRGEITQRDLLRNALRMRPDRIIVGEVRGAEAFDMLQAMNTGHDGSICTIHANTPRDALTRVENMVQMGTVNLPLRAIRLQVASAIDLIVQAQRMRDGQRRVTHVTEVCGMEGDIITTNDLFTFQYVGEGSDGKIQGRWETSGARPSFVDRLEYFGLLGAWLEATAGLSR